MQSEATAAAEKSAAAFEAGVEMSAADSRPDATSSSFFSSTSSSSSSSICPCLIDSSLASKPVSPLSHQHQQHKQSLYHNEASSESTEVSASENGAASGQPEWLHFDDTRVKTLTNMEFHRKILDSSYDSPYILFYVKD